MNGPTKLSLAVALALIGGNAFALGLGSIQVKSGLNQPLDAEIAVTTESAAETAGLNVSMASSEDFDRVGLSRGRVSIPIDFVVSTNSRGQAVIKVTTKEAVREPFLDFLIQVNWPKGKLLREYTVLLDPPITAPSRGTPAQVTPAKESAAAPATKLSAEEKQPKQKATSVKAPKSQASEPKQPPASKPAAPSSAPRTAGAGDYGPVAEGETLSEVARATRPDESTNVNQMMLALLKANPNAFYKDNINALKRGAILRIPSGDELKATGNAAAVAAAVREQNDSWTSGAAVAKPTVVANAGAPKNAPAPKTETKSSGKASEHLALVPPRAGKESQGTADHPGPSSGTGASADSKAELARTKEALASREQEATELKSRVKQLEDLNGKDQRLLSLKESEIAELQAKLKDLQSKATAPTAPATTTTPATKPTETAATKPAETAAKPGETKLTAQDIWGNIAATEKAGSKPAGTATTPSTTTTTTTPATSTTPATTGSTTPASTGTSTAATTTPPTTASTTPPPTTTPATGTTTTPSTTPASTTSTAPPLNGTTVTPVTTPSTTAPTSLTSTPPSTPASTVTKPAPPVTPPKPTPTPTVNTEQPWWQSNMVLLGGGVGLLLIGLLALMRFMRKPKPVLMPLGGGAEFEEHAVASGDEEHHLLDALAQNPGDAHLSLELLNLYYSQRDAAKFEAAAEAMYAHIADPTQPEWQQVKAMGEELCPHNPLFTAGDAVGLGSHGRQEHTVFGHYDAGTGQDDFDLGQHDGHETKAMPVEENFDFDLTDHSAGGAAPANDLGFAHEPPPPPPAPVRAPAPAPAATVRAPVHAPAPPAPKPAEDFFAGEDAIGTKLDLAKAYLDMGDPEGARSMLDEVMAEGNDVQKGEARKLLAEIR